MSTVAWTRHMSPTFISMVILEQEPIYSPAFIHPTHCNPENGVNTYSEILATLPMVKNSSNI
jgi:hypothetical protein